MQFISWPTVDLYKVKVCLTILFTSIYFDCEVLEAVSAPTFSTWVIVPGKVIVTGFERHIFINITPSGPAVLDFSIYHYEVSILLIPG